MAEDVAGIIFLARGLDRWEKKDTAKLGIEDEGDVTAEEEQSDCHHTVNI